VKAAVDELKRVLFQTDLREQMQAKIEARLARFQVRKDDERDHLTKALARLEGEIARLVTVIKTSDATTMPGAFATILGSIEASTAEKNDIERKLAALEPKAVPRVPTVEEIQRFVIDVEARLRGDPTAAREALRQVLGDGKIVLHPQPDGTYRAQSMLVLGKLAAKTPKPRSGEPSGASGTATTGEVVGIGSCAGQI
jgi:hypothetical protein